MEEARKAAIGFASRRRREAELPEVLAAEPLPEPHVPTRQAWPGDRPPVPMPAGAPPRPINQHQLWADCVWHAGAPRSADLEKIEQWIARAAAATKAMEAIDDATQQLQAAEAAAEEVETC